MAELTTVADDEAVVHDGAEARTLRRPRARHRPRARRASRSARCPDLGERLATVATVNDVHFGETECGVIDGPRRRPDLPRPSPGAEPYPEVMNRGAIEEIAAIDPDAVRGEGRPHLRRHSTRSTRPFLAAYGAAFGDRLAPRARQPRRLPRPDLRAGAARSGSTSPGVTLALLDTTDPRPHHRPGDRPSSSSGSTTSPPTADRPVLVFGHHHVWNPDVEPAARRLLRHPPRRLRARSSPSSPATRASSATSPATPTATACAASAATGDRPWVEVACVKDYPGTWAEYRVFERRRAAGPPPHLHARGAGVDRADPRHVRRHLRRRTRSARSSDRCFAMRRPRDRPGPAPSGRWPGIRVLDLATVIAGPGRRPLPGRLRRRRAQGRAARHRRQHPRHGRARPAPTARRCTGSSSRATSAASRSTSSPTTAARRILRARRRRPRPRRELPARHPRAPRPRARRAARAQPDAGHPPGHRLRPGRALRGPGRASPRIAEAMSGFAAHQRRARRRTAPAADRAHRRGHRAGRRLRHDGGAVVGRRARWST